MTVRDLIDATLLAVVNASAEQIVQRAGSVLTLPSQVEDLRRRVEQLEDAAKAQQTKREYL